MRRLQNLPAQVQTPGALMHPAWVYCECISNRTWQQVHAWIGGACHPHDLEGAVKPHGQTPVGLAFPAQLQAYSYANRAIISIEGRGDLDTEVHCSAE